jgi:putative membrane protein
MVRDHTVVNQQALALVNKLNVKPQPNSTSASLQASAKTSARTVLRQAGTTGFYCRYHPGMTGRLIIAS